MKQETIGIIIAMVLLIGIVLFQVYASKTPMEYAQRHDVQFNGTHYISNEVVDGYVEVCLVHPINGVMPTSCHWESEDSVTTPKEKK